ncbi:MAG TPA: hypothetical protein VGD17_01160, partial [Chitinophagaceae bacterium]
MNFLTLLLLLISSLSFAQAQKRELQIHLKNNDSLELQTKEQLQKLISTYDLNKWMFTDKII